MMENPIFSKKEIVDTYRKRAERYDFTANFYYLIGFRAWAYRRRAVESLDLHRGDTVVEIGCGTGLNFPLLQEAVGPTGRIIGVDLTDAMLVQARQRVIDKGWSNVDLVLSDADSFSFPIRVDGILSTFALTLVPEYDQIIRRGSQALAPGKRWVILDFKLPDNWLATLAPLLAFLTSPFGVRLKMASRHPWESVERYLQNTRLTQIYGGFAYIVEGERSTEKRDHERPVDFTASKGGLNSLRGTP
jgi:ubiquinone/menaquinone biosynthesis C-methylase UbiE